MAVALTLSASAQAQDEKARANARAAANAGADAFEQKDYESSIAYFERAESQFHSPVHLWYIARAAKEVGKLVKAREACVKVRREGAPSGASRGVIKANEGCTEILAALEGRIPKVLVELEGVPEGVQVTVMDNDAEYPRAVVGIPAPIDPGEHRFVARADGWESEPVSLVIDEGASEKVTLVLQAAAPADAATADASSDEGPDADPTADSRGGLPAPHWPAMVAWGAGLGGIGAGVAFGIISKNKADDADELCGGTREECALDAGSDDALRVSTLNDQAGDNRTFAIIGYGAGGALIATGVVLWLLDVGGSKSSTAVGSKSALRLTPVLGYRSLGIRGTF